MALDAPRTLSHLVLAAAAFDDSVQLYPVVVTIAQCGVHLAEREIGVLVLDFSGAPAVLDLVQRHHHDRCPLRRGFARRQPHRLRCGKAPP
jgi:hypothetical protein